MNASKKNKVSNGSKPSNGAKSNRLLVFEALRRNKHGLTSAELREKIGMSPTHGQMGILLRSELAVKRFKVSKEDRDGRDVRVYTLTDKGRKALEDGTVDALAKEKHLTLLGRSEL